MDVLGRFSYPMGGPEGFDPLKTDGPIDPGSALGQAMQNGGSLSAYITTSAAGQNAVMNGAMSVWQRNTSFAAATHNTVCADRWRYQKLITGAVHTLSRSTDVPATGAGYGFPYSLLIDNTTADAALGVSDFVSIMQRIEGMDWVQFHGQPCVISFWVKATKTGVYSVALTNSAQDRCMAVGYTVNVADTWERKIIRIPAYTLSGGWSLPTSDYCALHFTIMAGSQYHVSVASSWLAESQKYAVADQVNACDSISNNFYLAGVQLERGNAPTYFEMLPFSEELRRCERFFEKSFNYPTTPTYGSGINAATSFVQAVGPAALQDAALVVNFRVRKYVAITGSNSFWYNPVTAASAQIRNITAALDCTGTAIQTASDSCMVFSATTPAGSAAGQILAMAWAADAEI